MTTYVDFVRDTLLPNAIVPQRATDGSAAYDLFAAHTYTESTGYIVVDTGIRTQFSPSYVMLVYGRSGYARKHGISLVNHVGVIDSDYRGNIQLVFDYDRRITSEDEALELLAPGKRVAQAILSVVPPTMWNLVPSLQSSVRGTGGFGSTGS